jgi:hypothetical protein
MNKLLGALVIVLLTVGLAYADLDGYMDSLRISADANFGDFRAGLGAHFGASGAELDRVFLAVGDPSEAALCFWLARTSGRPMDDVLHHYRANGKKGWGALAQSLGIKPGSAEFKALKAGQIGWTPPGGHNKSQGGNDHKPKNSKGGKDKNSNGKGTKDNWGKDKGKKA